jgi:hypothetical protein
VERRVRGGLSQSFLDTLVECHGRVDWYDSDEAGSKIAV